MAKVFIEENTLTAIGNAIRTKEGTTELIPVTTMAARITNLPSEGGETIPPEALSLSSDCSYKFSNNGWNWFIDKYGAAITTSKLSNIGNMFYNCTTLKAIPFDLEIYNADCKSTFYECRALTSTPTITNNYTYVSYQSLADMFNLCMELRNIGRLYNMNPSSMSNLFKYCYRLREIPDDFFSTWNFTQMNTYAYASANSIFYNCASLREIPTSLFNNLTDTLYTSYYSSLYYELFYGCNTLNEALNIPVSSATLTSNVFQSTFVGNYLLKNFTFRMNEDGSAKTAKWSNQKIDLSGNTGWAGNASAASSIYSSYNSGITADKKVTDEASYQALKNDPDWFTADKAYSKYNYTSAEKTIRSLPDTSAYGINTIVFCKDAGTSTDGGGITEDSMTELSAEAAAKGWTVSLK